YKEVDKLDPTLINSYRTNYLPLLWDQFSKEVIYGIELHHKIDFFTDNHAVVERSKKRLRNKHGKYTPVVMDIVYDHFLAANFPEYSKVELPRFVDNCYALFHRRWDELPPGIQYMLPYMERDNWLVNYQSREGLQRALAGMSRRASFENKMDEATGDIFKDYKIFEADFREYFPLLRNYVEEEIRKLPW
ncbi:MAG: ACP phosphodiesterase, partial [Owenweeksia sp.]